MWVLCARLAFHWPLWVGAGSTPHRSVSYRQGCGTIQILYTIDRNVDWRAIGKLFTVAAEGEHMHNLWPSSFTCRQVPKRNAYTQKLKSTRMLIAALLVIVQTWNLPKCPSIKEWMVKLWYIYTMEHYTTKKYLELHKFEFILQKQWWAKNFQTKKQRVLYYFLYIYSIYVKFRSRQNLISLVGIRKVVSLGDGTDGIGEGARQGLLGCSNVCFLDRDRFLCEYSLTCLLMILHIFCMCIIHH